MYILTFNGKYFGQDGHGDYRLFDHPTCAYLMPSMNDFKIFIKAIATGMRLSDLLTIPDIWRDFRFEISFEPDAEHTQHMRDCYAIMAELHGQKVTITMHKVTTSPAVTYILDDGEESKTEILPDLKASDRFVAQKPDGQFLYCKAIRKIPGNKVSCLVINGGWAIAFDRSTGIAVSRTGNGSRIVLPVPDKLDGIKPDDYEAVLDWAKIQMKAKS